MPYKYFTIIIIATSKRIDNTSFHGLVFALCLPLVDCVLKDFQIFKLVFGTFC